MDPKLVEYMKGEIDRVTDDWSMNSHYWNQALKRVQPIVKISEAVGLDTEELRRACKAYENALTHLKHVSEMQQSQLRQSKYSMDTRSIEEDVT